MDLSIFKVLLMASLALCHCRAIKEEVSVAPPDLPKADGRYRYFEEKSGKYGYIDRAGKIIIPPRFDDGQMDFQDLGWVYINGTLAYANKTGQLVTTLKREQWGYLDSFFSAVNGCGVFRNNVALIEVD